MKTAVLCVVASLVQNTRGGKTLPLPACLASTPSRHAPPTCKIDVQLITHSHALQSFIHVIHLLRASRDYLPTSSYTTRYQNQKSIYMSHTM